MHRALVAQLDRVTDYESVGRGFESLPSHQEKHRFFVDFHRIDAFLFVIKRRLAAFSNLLNFYRKPGSMEKAGQIFDIWIMVDDRRITADNGFIFSQPCDTLANVLTIFASNCHGGNENPGCQGQPAADAGLRFQPRQDWVRRAGGKSARPLYEAERRDEPTRYNQMRVALRLASGRPAPSSILPVSCGRRAFTGSATRAANTPSCGRRTRGAAVPALARRCRPTAGGTTRILMTCITTRDTSGGG